MQTVDPRIKTRYIEPDDVGFSVISGKSVNFEQREKHRRRTESAPMN